MPNPFDGYIPTADDRDPVRPWWSRPRRVPGLGEVARRVDGVGLSSTDILTECRPQWRSAEWDAEVAEHLAAIDAEKPMAVPPFRVGQVWWSPKSGHMAVLAVRPDGEGLFGVGAMPDFRSSADIEAERWVLVRGPGGPWAPPGWVVATGDRG